MSDPVLALSGIRRSYRQGKTALDILKGVELAIVPGELVALVGPSGSGKSTLLHIAGLLDAPNAGEIRIGGTVIALADETARTKARRESLGFVYQFHHLLPEFSARENVALPLLISGIAESVANARADDLLERVGLAARRAHRPAELSGGEQQRVALARALANKPALVLADEPTGNLDPGTAASAFNLLLTIARSGQTAILMATHNMELAAKMDRAVRLEDGVLVAVT